MSGIGLIVLGSLAGLVLLAPRRWALIGMTTGMMFLTLGQWIDFFNLHLFPIRVLIVAAFFRVLVRREWSLRSLNAVDKALVLAYAYRTGVFLASGNGSATTALGLLIDVTLAYVALRGLLRDFDDLTWLLKGLVVLLVPYAAMLNIEASQHGNPFAVVGGIQEIVLRDGRPRVLGSFAHASLLGTFAASFLPLFIALALTRRRAWGICGIALCLDIVYLSNSGGPLGCAALAGIGWLFWFVRAKMAMVRGAIVAILVTLAVFMRAPLWFLPAKLSLLFGGDGWHRSYLMDIALRNLDRWWVSGVSVTETRAWFPYTVITGGADIINGYLDFGLAGGVAAIVLFCSMLVRAYRSLGHALADERIDAASPARRTMLWGLGVVLSVHVFNWFALTYFDQVQIVFLLQLAALSTLSDPRLHRGVAPEHEPVANARELALDYATRRST